MKRLLNHRRAGDVTARHLARNVERLRPPMQQITDPFVTLSGVQKPALVDYSDYH